MSPLHVVTAVANPIRWDSRINLYHLFKQHILDMGLSLTVVECAYGERPFELESPFITHVPVRAKTLLWNKENLLNLGIARLPDDWKYVAWVDADIHFRDPAWALNTVHALQHYDLVQPWSDCYDLGPGGEHMQVHRAFARLVQEGKPIVQGPRLSAEQKAGFRFGHPGYAWAATREALTRLGGLYEVGVLGSGDHHMAFALIGRAEDSYPVGVSSGYIRPLLTWQDRATRHVAGNIGYVPGVIEHGWHGSKQNRRYLERWQVLLRNAYDPDTDLIRNTWGVFELAGNKPKLRQDIDRYFRSRDEDSNCLDA